MSPFIIAIIIAFISSMLAKAKQADEVKRTPSSPLPPPDDLEQAARTRRIQEEIRRKIAERRGVATPSPEATPPVAPPIFSDWSAGPLPPVDPFGGSRARPARATVRRELEPPPVPVAAEQERQVEIAGQLAALAEAQATAGTIAAARVAETSWTEATKSATGASAWRKDLRSGADLRRAVVLRELIGPPVALR